MWLLLPVLWSLLWNTCAAEYASLDTWTDAAQRAQRDISRDIPLNHLTNVGVSLGEPLFGELGYSTDSLWKLQHVLGELSSFMVDLYWNEYTEMWQLCPAPIPLDATTNHTETVSVTWNNRKYLCQPAFSLASVMETVSKYLSESNVDYKANVVQMVFALHKIEKAPVLLVSYNSTRNLSRSSVSYMAVGSQSLSEGLSKLGGFLYGPSQSSSYHRLNSTDNYDNRYPSQNDFLFNMYKRAYIVAARQDDMLYNITTTDKNHIFFLQDQPHWLETHSNDTLVDCMQTASENYLARFFQQLATYPNFKSIVDSAEHPFTTTTVAQYLECGMSPILNSTNYSFQAQNLLGLYVDAVLDKFVPLSFWLWAPHPIQQVLTNHSTLDNPDDDEDSWYKPSSTRTANQCVVMTSEGWKTGNCYDKYRLACKSRTNQFDWVLSEEVHAYVDASDKDCPPKYSFGLPKLSAEQMALHSFILSKNIRYPLWIDLNDITVPDCFVTGGPYASCPYRKIVSTRNLIRLIAPLAVVSFVILVVISYERTFFTTPLHTNRRRHWKRAINQYYKNYDYEGVPL